jgi:hypothetical protein
VKGCDEYVQRIVECLRDTLRRTNDVMSNRISSSGCGFQTVRVMRVAMILNIACFVSQSEGRHDAVRICRGSRLTLSMRSTAITPGALNFATITKEEVFKMGLRRIFVWSCSIFCDLFESHRIGFSPCSFLLHFAQQV